MNEVPSVAVAGWRQEEEEEEAVEVSNSQTHTSHKHDISMPSIRSLPIQVPHACLVTQLAKSV